MKSLGKEIYKIMKQKREEYKKGNHKNDSILLGYEWEDVDFEKWLEQNKKLNQFRGKIIDSVIMLEFFLGATIRNYLFGGNTKHAQLFEKCILLKLSFSLKIGFLENIININKPVYIDQTREWLNKLKNINSIRNFLAHGIQSNDFPKLYNNDIVPEVSLFKKVDYSSFNLSEEEIKNIEKNIAECTYFIVDKFTKEGFENYLG